MILLYNLIISPRSWRSAWREHHSLPAHTTERRPNCKTCALGLYNSVSISKRSDSLQHSLLFEVELGGGQGHVLLVGCTRMLPQVAFFYVVESAGVALREASMSRPSCSFVVFGGWEEPPPTGQHKEDSPTTWFWHYVGLAFIRDL